MTPVPRPRPRMRRAVMAVLLVAVVGAGLVVHRALPDTAATDIAGDVLYALAAYAGFGMLLPRLRPLLVGTAAGAWCVAVELFQLTGLPERAASSFPPVVLLLGTVFDARDLVCYVLAVAAATAVDAGAGRLRDRYPGGVTSSARRRRVP